MKRRKYFLTEVNSNHPEAIPFIEEAEARKKGFVLCNSVDQNTSVVFNHQK
jgi:hypothetical protein